MTLSLRLHPGALRELHEAAAYYDAEGPGLGSVLVNEVERAFTQILRFPEAAPRVRGEVRKKSVAVFPYSVVYALTDDALVVLAVAHHARRPFYWSARE
jgi:toxin ParE1/3/4